MNQEEKFLQGGKEGFGGKRNIARILLGEGKGETIVREKKPREICMPKKIRVLSACSILIVFFSVYSRYGKTKVDSFFKLNKNAGRRGKSPFSRSEEE